MAEATKRRVRLRMPSPAMTVACIALAVALSGASYAAVALPRNSVGTAQLKQNAVNSAKVRDNSLRGTDINEATLGQVPSANTANTAGSASIAAAADTATNAQNAANADRLDNLDSADFLRNNGKAVDADRLDGTDSAGFVQGTGKTYVGRIVLPTSNPFPSDVVLTVPAFATIRALNCQSGGANVSLGDFQQTRGTFTMWRDTGDVNPGYFSSPGAFSWNSNFQDVERTTWHMSVGTGAAAEAAIIDVYTKVDGTNCVYSAVAQVWGR